MRPDNSAQPDEVSLGCEVLGLGACGLGFTPGCLRGGRGRQRAGLDNLQEEKPRIDQKSRLTALRFTVHYLKGGLPIYNRPLSR